MEFSFGSNLELRHRSSSAHRVQARIPRGMIRLSDRLITIAVISMMRITEQVKSQKQGFRMPGKPKIEERNGDDRQHQGDADGQTDPEIQYKVNNHSKESSNGVINSKD